MITYKKFTSFLMPWLALALLMNLTRFAMTDIQSYVYMNWNLFLSFLPLLFVYIYEKKRNIYIKSLTFFAWLFFLPNAVYMVTDLIHLRDVGPGWMLWYDGMMIFIYALVGIFISAYVLLRMKENIFKKSIRKQNIFLIAVSIMSSFGVYLGRHLRWNSWDIFAKPIDLSADLLKIVHTEYANPVFILTIIFFTLFILTSALSLEKVFKK